MKIITQAMLDEQRLSAFAQLKIFAYTLLMIPVSVVFHLITTTFGLLTTIVLIPTTTYDILYKLEKAKQIINEKVENGTL